MPEIHFDEDDRVRVLGIGSGLAPRLWMKEPLPRYAILGSGAGYSRFKFTLGGRYPLYAVSLEEELKKKSPLPPDWMPASSRIYWVRGPLTTELLNLDPKLACGDPVTFLSRFTVPQGSPQTTVGYMPHFRSARLTHIQAICAEAGVTYIDPGIGIESVIEQLQGCQLLITEALHGAIAADSLRVPWIPVVSSSLILDFKWQDYCRQMGVNYQPHYLPPVWNISAIMRDEKCAIPVSLRPLAWLRGVLSKNGKHKKAIRQLLRLKDQRPVLASELTVRMAQERMDQALSRFVQDVSSGFWSAKSVE